MGIQAPSGVWAIGQYWPSYQEALAVQHNAAYRLSTVARTYNQETSLMSSPEPIVAHPESLTPDAGDSVVAALGHLADVWERDRPTLVDRSLIEAIITAIVVLANNQASTTSATPSGGA